MIDESVIFKQSNFYEKNIKFFSLNLDKLLKKKKLNSKNLSILDYGCGNCLLHKYIKFKKIFLFDIDSKYYDYLFLKNVKKFKNFNEIIENKNKFNLILVNSVIQYIEPEKLEKISKDLYSKLNKNGLIIISDIPAKSRFLEIFSSANLIYSLKTILYFIAKPKYFNLQYFIYPKKILSNIIKRKKYKFEFLDNLNISKSRYTLVIKKN
tara:strand:- start:115 stop:741 length:627 start_codon:yes stop_codon:yes gene_type:complete